MQKISLTARAVCNGCLVYEQQVAPRSTLSEPLSAREWDVLHQVAEGFSNQQIAEHLVLSLYTVKLHVKHLLAKLGATNRTQAVVRARALQILPREEVIILQKYLFGGKTARLILR